MAEKKELVAQGVVGTDGNVSITSGAEMPPDEPGHKGAEINAGDTPFDPNAARRYAEGRGPGMQDSERLQPAHWVQPLGAVAAAEAEVKQAEQVLDAAKKRLADAKKA